MAGIAALVQYTEYNGLSVTQDDSTLSYLPLAHIFDRVVEEFALYAGARIGYYQARCLLLPLGVSAFTISTTDGGTLSAEPSCSPAWNVGFAGWQSAGR